MSKLLFAFVLLAASFPAFGQSPEPSGHGVVLPSGITLPRTGMAYAVEKKAGESSLVPLHATEVVSNSHAGGTSHGARSS